MMPEVLAPVGGKEQLVAAVRCGADAVYFGTPDFNARRNAENFTSVDFTDAVEYCGIRGVKVYVTLNTLIKDCELGALRDTVRLIAASGADAVIVQDLGVAAVVKEMCPTLRLHASTQMAVHNVSGVKMLEELGFRRVVLARELSLNEIAAISSHTPLETEVFVHGAHCMSVSGLCYMSSVFGCRSGNRGLCAQPCRLDFRSGSREYALSLKDMSLIGHLKELSEAGVTSFKIEGRMKRPEYVAAAVTAVKNGISGKPADTQTLKNVFSRGGFTDGYLTGQRDLSMFGHRTREDVVAASPDVFRVLQGLYRDEKKSVPVTVSFKAEKGAPAFLEMSDGVNSAAEYGPEPESAEKLSLTREMCERSLLKLGGTPYYCEELTTDIGEGIMLSASALNALRRNAAEKLSEKRKKAPHTVYEVPDVKGGPRLPGEGGLRLRFETAQQICVDDAAERLILPLREILSDTGLIDRYGPRLAAELPVLIYPGDEDRIRSELSELKKIGLENAVCENIGAVFLAKNAGLVPSGGAHLNVLNSRALAEYEKTGVSDFTLSFEMNFDDIKNISADCRVGFIACGHLPLMRFRNCPGKGKNGCSDCGGRRIIKDRYSADFVLLCSEKRYSTLYNPIPVYTGNTAMPRTDFYTLYFTVESKKECEELIRAFVDGKQPAMKKTFGLYDKNLL